MAEETKFTYEEWDLLEKARSMTPEDGEKIIVVSYKKKIAMMSKTDKLLPFELAKEYSYEEYLRIRILMVRLKQKGAI